MYTSCNDAVYKANCTIWTSKRAGKVENIARNILSLILRAILRSSLSKSIHFHGFCSIPLRNSSDMRRSEDYGFLIWQPFWRFITYAKGIEHFKVKHTSPIETCSERGRFSAQRFQYVSKNATASLCSKMPAVYHRQMELFSFFVLSHRFFESR